VFRAADPGDGYLWLLGNHPSPGAPNGSLTKALLRNGSAQVLQVLPLPFAINPGVYHHVVTRAAGSQLTTAVDGVVVDTTTDTSFAGGRVGFRESDGEAAAFRNVTVSALDGSQLLSESFGGDLSGERSVLARTPESFSAGARPGNGVPHGIGDGNNRVVE